MSRPILGFRTGSLENFKAFKAKNPSIDIDFKTYLKVLYTYNSIFINHILETGDKVKIPWGLGTLTINKYKPTKFKKDDKIGLSIDWKETNLQGKRIYHLNPHTNGYKYYWMWEHQASYIKCSFIWKFELARVHSRMLKTYLKKPNSKYKNIYKQYNKKLYYKK